MTARRFTPTKTRQAESLEILRELLKPGDTVYVITMQVARSGLSRRVKVLIPRLAPGPPLPGGTWGPERPVIRDITWHVGNALRWQLIDDGSWELRVDGTGMDARFHTVYTLAHALFGNGYDLVHESL